MHPRILALVAATCAVAGVLGGAACKSRSQPPVAASSVAAGDAGPPPVAVERAAESAAKAGQLMPEPAGAVEEGVPFAPCPLSGDMAQDPDRLLDQAAMSYDLQEFAVAYSCADMAADLVPRSVDAHHIRAAAAAALGHYDAAQVAFSMAMALDPHDPETLAAAADFYINVLPPKRRETTMVGLELARRGGARAVVRRRTGQELRARLALLEGQAYNDLGQSDESLERVDEALNLAPELIEALHERGVALFNLCRFEDARTAFEEVLRRTPDDPYAHHHLGLIDERLGNLASSEMHFLRARAIDPVAFWAPVLLSPREFQAEIDEALAELPAPTRRKLQDVTVGFEDVPALADLTAVEPPFAPTILGLFRGLPHGVEISPEEAGEPIPPRAIVLYRKNLARAVKTREELDMQIRRTLHHELGHLDGLDEGDLRRRGLD